MLDVDQKRTCKLIVNGLMYLFFDDNLMFKNTDE